MWFKIPWILGTKPSIRPIFVINFESFASYRLCQGKMSQIFGSVNVIRAFANPLMILLRNGTSTLNEFLNLLKSYGRMNEFHRGLHKLLVREIFKFKALCPLIDSIISIFINNYFRRADFVVKLQKTQYLSDLILKIHPWTGCLKFKHFTY